MIRLIQFLIFGHWHKWKIIESGKTYAKGDASKMASGAFYILQCEHCGKVSSSRLLE